MGLRVGPTLFDALQPGPRDHRRGEVGGKGLGQRVADRPSQCSKSHIQAVGQQG